MSVPKSERRQSNVEYVTIIQKLEQFFITKNLDENNRIPGLSDELVKLSIEAYNYATLYYEMVNGRVIGTTAHKKKYCKNTIWTVRNLAAQINILVAFRMESRKPVKELLEKTEDILKACEILQAQLTILNKEDKE